MTLEIRSGPYLERFEIRPPVWEGFDPHVSPLDLDRGFRARLARAAEHLRRRSDVLVSRGRTADELAFLRCVAAVSCSDVWTVRHHRRRALQIPRASRELGVEAIPPEWFDKARLAIRLGWVGRPETWPR